MWDETQDPWLLFSLSDVGGESQRFSYVGGVRSVKGVLLLPFPMRFTYNLIRKCLSTGRIEYLTSEKR